MIFHGFQSNILQCTHDFMALFLIVIRVLRGSFFGEVSSEWLRRNSTWRRRAIYPLPSHWSKLWKQLNFNTDETSNQISWYILSGWSKMEWIACKSSREKLKIPWLIIKCSIFKIAMYDAYPIPNFRTHIESPAIDPTHSLFLSPARLFGEFVLRSNNSRE